MDILASWYEGVNSINCNISSKNFEKLRYSSEPLLNIAYILQFHVAINYIKKVPDKIFANNPRLEDVRMWANHLECIPKSTFAENLNLGWETSVMPCNTIIVSRILLQWMALTVIALEQCRFLTIKSNTVDDQLPRYHPVVFCLKIR